MGFAGFVTTANTVYVYLSIISPHLNVQAKLQEEVDRLVRLDRCIRLADKGDMHYYAQATVLELLRYATVASFAPRHVSKVTTDPRLPQLAPVLSAACFEDIAERTKMIFDSTFFCETKFNNDLSALSALYAKCDLMIKIWQFEQK
ncbi:hypothetical protein CAPTEDRAFT_206765 [Capitella teleta]|uniref:Uncharacterized protein n=1 Tax=Capitella teleta TaxID=283909 RepID=R7UDU5_CAPTE|nr:hypothetical protein CAPTEDRAFT_206765 [Capitella teleta]|eukprot:ELU01417.1 hypothetical protein CAPTEDRAFT_206765 [Capitella teleta]